jgi:hypothetical protein
MIEYFCFQDRGLVVKGTDPNVSDIMERAGEVHDQSLNRRINQLSNESFGEVGKL